MIAGGGAPARGIRSRRLSQHLALIGKIGNLRIAPGAANEDVHRGGLAAKNDAMVHAGPEVLWQ
jgi:hypothetical protein